MRRKSAILPLLPLLLIPFACEPADNVPPFEMADDETGGSADKGEGDDKGESEGEDENEGDGDGDGDDEALDCASACGAAIGCPDVDYEPGAFEECVQYCEASLEGTELAFGSDCAQAQQDYMLCMLANDCSGAFEECAQVMELAYNACSEAVPSEMHELCECIYHDEDDPYEKQWCVVDEIAMVAEAYVLDGQACMEVAMESVACNAAVCQDPTCQADPFADACLCSELDDKFDAACPSGW